MWLDGNKQWLLNLDCEVFFPIWDGLTWTCLSKWTQAAGWSHEHVDIRDAVGGSRSSELLVCGTDWILEKGWRNVITDVQTAGVHVKTASGQLLIRKKGDGQSRFVDEAPRIVSPNIRSFSVSGLFQAISCWNLPSHTLWFAAGETARFTACLIASSGLPEAVARYYERDLLAEPAGLNLYLPKMAAQFRL